MTGTTHKPLLTAEDVQRAIGEDREVFLRLPGTDEWHQTFCDDVEVIRDDLSGGYEYRAATANTDRQEPPYSLSSVRTFLRMAEGGEGGPWNPALLAELARVYLRVYEAPTPPPCGGEAVYGLFRALVDAGGPDTIARHGVERGSDEWSRKVRAGMLAIERQFHPERFDDGAALASTPAQADDDRFPQPGSKVWQLSSRIGDLTAENTGLRARIAELEADLADRIRRSMLRAADSVIDAPAGQAVTELIEADRAYDAALADHHAAINAERDVRMPLYERYKAAEKRRADALAALTPPAGEGAGNG